VIPSSEDQLFAPLLRSDDEQERQESSAQSVISAALNAASALAMDPPASDANNPNSPTSNSNMQTSQNSLLSRFLRMRTAADALPMLLNAIVTDGKMACFVFFGVYVSLVLLWLPFWLLTFLIGEIGVYALTFATIFFVGRVLIRYVTEV
jgi:hypothetical protein